MKKYDGLLLKVAHQYHILKGTQETEEEWKARLVYSICGMMAYASLWEGPERSVSIVHLKRKVHDIFVRYYTLYPELSESFPASMKKDTKALEDEIESIFRTTGVVYHRSNRIAPCIKREEAFGNILFQRGIALDDISCVSGLGFYSMNEIKTLSDQVKAMFGLEQKNLQELWQRALARAAWRSGTVFDDGTEYLRVRPPFSHGYWQKEPDKTGRVSLLRVGMRGAQQYYLYRNTDVTLEVSPLPQWQVAEYHYRLLACACLSVNGTLPPVAYSEDGALIHVHMHYLLPPRELEFLKLYSWPESCIQIPSNFKRKLSREVFVAMKDILSGEGYHFKNVKGK